MEEVKLAEELAEELATARAGLDKEYSGVINYEEIDGMAPAAQIEYYAKLKYCVLASELMKAQVRGQRPDAKYLRQWAELKSVE